MSEIEKVQEERITIWQRLKNWARLLKRDVITLYYAIRHPLTPWYAKAVAIVVVGYALSPIDLIPDFVPVFGYLDDVILVPLGVALVIKLMPCDVFELCRQEAAQNLLNIKPKSWFAAVVIIAIWLLVAYGLFNVFRQ